MMNLPVRLVQVISGGEAMVGVFVESIELYLACHFFEDKTLCCQHRGSGPQSMKACLTTQYLFVTKVVSTHEQHPGETGRPPSYVIFPGESSTKRPRHRQLQNKQLLRVFSASHPNRIPPKCQ